MSLTMHLRTAFTALLLSSTAIILPVNAESDTLAQTVPSPDSLLAQRYSNTAAEIFWARPATFGLRYEISRDGTILTITDGVSYYDQSLIAQSAPTYAIIAIDRQGQRSSPSSITVPTRNTSAEIPASPESVTATRYSSTAAELFWSRSTTFGLRYEISRDGMLLGTISGVSYFDSTLGANSSPTYDIIAIDRQGRRSLPSSITVPTHNPPAATLAAPSDVVALRYSGTSAELFWARPATFGLSYEISRDGSFLGNTTGVSYLDNSLDRGESPTYSIIAINRQGVRSSPATVKVPASNIPNPEPVAAVINLDSYTQILQELVILINAAPLHDTLNAQPSITDAGITFVSVSTEPVEDEVFGLGFVYDYSCDAGGSIERFSFPEPGSQKYTFVDCVLAAGKFSGILKEFFVGREGSGVNATDFVVDTGNETRKLSGRHESSSFRGVAGLNRDWLNTSLDVLSSESTLTLRSYELDATSVYNPTSNVNDSNLLVSFDVTAPWTGEQSIHVEVSLQTSMEPDTVFTWKTGEIVAIAEDGSQLTLTPADAVQRTFNVAVSGNDELISRQWSDGFEIYCAYADMETCGSFRDR